METLDPLRPSLGEIALTVGVVVVVLVVVAAAVTMIVRRRRDRLGPSREDLTALGENQRRHGRREHGQVPGPHRRVDQQGWF